LAQAGLSPDGLVVHGGFTLDCGRDSARTLLTRPDRPTAVICSSDVIAIGVLQAAREAGLRVPDDLSVVGFDGIEAATWVEPELTTIEQPIQQIAATAVDLLRTVIADPTRSLPRVLLQPRLRAGGSTARPAAD
jgi:DNA-binding LacI/PurR family transcriptional regulator